MRKWLPESEWRVVQQRIPITCVDVLGWRRPARGRQEVGLICRDTPQWGPRWCLIGGRLLLDESFRSAILRQVRETLGATVKCAVEAAPQPIFVGEYFLRKRKQALFDPRQHAIGLTFVAALDDEATPIGEAVEFKWFDSTRLPAARAFGFGQKKVVLACLRSLHS